MSPFISPPRLLQTDLIVFYGKFAIGGLAAYPIYDFSFVGECCTCIVIAHQAIHQALGDGPAVAGG